MDVETLMVHPDALPPETLVSGWRVLGKSGRGGFGGFSKPRCGRLIVTRVDVVREGHVVGELPSLWIGGEALLE
jgi:hypothetical protein